MIIQKWTGYCGIFCNIPKKGRGMIWLLSCFQNGSESRLPDEHQEITTEEFSVIIIADPHVAQAGEYEERLRMTVDWINTHKEEEDIAFVAVLGDVGWGEGLVLAHEALEKLDVPYIPIIGDNEVHFGDEERFFTIFEGAYTQAQEWCSDWNDSFSVVWNPEHEQDSSFGNFSCLFRNTRFYGLDWASRHSGSILGEMGDLHDFDGGSLDWFRQELITDEESSSPIFLFTHIPMYVNGGAFDIYEMATLEELLASYSDRLISNFAGHYHSDSYNELDLYDLVVVDAIWDDKIRFQKLTISQTGTEFSFSRELITLD